VVFPGLSDAEVLRLVNQHTPGGQEQSLSEEAVELHELHEESILSAEQSLGEQSVGRLVASPDERGGRASAAMARRSLVGRLSPTPLLDEPSLSAARNSGASRNTGGSSAAGDVAEASVERRRRRSFGDVATQPSDPLADLMQLSTGQRRRILERQASGMHHSQAYELEGLTRQAAAPESSSSKPSRFALRRANTTSPRASPAVGASQKVRRQSSGAVLDSGGGDSERRSSGDRRSSGETSGTSGARNLAAAAGAATFAFAARQARNAGDVVRWASLPGAMGAADQSVLDVDEMRQVARHASLLSPYISVHLPAYLGRWRASAPSGCRRRSRAGAAATRRAAARRPQP